MRRWIWVTVGLLTSGVALAVWLQAAPFDVGREPALRATDSARAPEQVAPLPQPAHEPTASAVRRAKSLPPDPPASDAASAMGPHRLLAATDNVLLLGLDRNPGVRRGGLTDTLIIAAFDDRRGKLGLVSVPRDLYVEVEGHGRTRINAVYALAKRDKKEPLQQLGRVMEDTLGIPIQHTIAIDLGVLERVVDILGGIEVDVPCPIIDRFIDSRVDGGRRLLDVHAGRQQMDGATAAMYVRSRHGRSDWSRASRQQAVLVALRQRVAQPRTLVHLPELLAEVEGSIFSDLSRMAMLNLARKALSVKVSRLHGVVLGRNETVPVRTEERWSVLLTDDEAIEHRLSELFVAPRPDHSSEICPDADVALRHRGRPTAKDGTK